jgi:hypothetical protein
VQPPCLTERGGLTYSAGHVPPASRIRSALALSSRPGRAVARCRARRAHRAAAARRLSRPRPRGRPRSRRRAGAGGDEPRAARSDGRGAGRRDRAGARGRADRRLRRARGRRVGAGPGGRGPRGGAGHLAGGAGGLHRERLRSGVPAGRSSGADPGRKPCPRCAGTTTPRRSGGPAPLSPPWRRRSTVWSSEQPRPLPWLAATRPERAARSGASSSGRCSKALPADVLMAGLRSLDWTCCGLDP